MELVSLVHGAVVASVLLALILASYSDHRFRSVSDVYWVFIGAVGVIGNLACAWMDGAFTSDYILIVFSEALVLAYALTGYRLLGIFSMVIAGIFSILEYDDSELLSVVYPVISCFLFIAAYVLGIIRGGADAKCLMVVALSIPEYSGYCFFDCPDVMGLVQTVFSPSVSILFTASILSVVACSSYCMIRSSGSGLRLRLRIRGYLCPLDQVDARVVWPMEDLTEGGRVFGIVPADEEVQSLVEKYRDAGMIEMLVTPKVPFIIFITAALVLVLCGLNPLFSI